MATVGRFKVANAFIQPGETIHQWWNNTPKEIVCIVDCMPFANGTPAEIEIVRTWNVRQVGGTNAEREFHWKVKNRGKSSALIDIYMAQIN